MKTTTTLHLVLLFALLGLTRLPADPLPGLYLTNAVVLSNGWGQFEVRTPDTNQPYVLLTSWAKDFSYGLPRWETVDDFPLNPATNRHLITIPVPMSTLGSIFWRAAPLGQSMDWLSYSISSHGTLSNGVGVVQWPKQPDSWSARLTVENATNFPAVSEVLFTGPPGGGITDKLPDYDSGGGYKHDYSVWGPAGTLPPAGNWHVQYGTNALTFPMADPQVSSRVVPVPSLVLSGEYLTSVSWTYHDPTTGAALAALPDYIAGSRSVTVSGTTGSKIYDSPPQDRTTTSHVFDPPVRWSDVDSVNIGFHDSLGNTYSFYFRKTAIAVSPYTYITNNGAITITKYTGSGGVATIPSMINDLPVTIIWDYAFRSCSSLTNISIPNSVTSIGKSAFSSCTNLTDVTIGNSVTTIGGGAFSSCTSLLSVTIPDSVTSIGASAFDSCTSLTDATIGNSVASIGYNAFRSCSSLTNISIPDSVTTIGAWAFFSCTSLTDATIGNSVTSIGNWAFRSCTRLTYVTIGNSVTSIGDMAFDSCTRLLSVTIPDSVTSIGDYAFYYCTILTDVTIGNSVTTIGDHAFGSCTRLTDVTIPDSVTSIGDYAFYYCTRLTDVTIGNSVTTIGYRAFGSCTSLLSVTIPASVTSIGDMAFSYCTSLLSVTIPASVTSIGDMAFSYCTSLTAITVDTSNPAYSSADGFLFNQSQTTLIQCPGARAGSYSIPDNVTNIGGGAFSSCTSLLSVTIPDSVTSIGDMAFSYCTSLTAITVDTSNSAYSSADGFLFNQSQTTLIQCPGARAGSYSIPDNVTNIGGGAFSSCTSLLSVTIPDSVTSIGDDAFNYCTRLTNISIPNSVTSIGDDAFNYCTNLTDVTIGNSVTTIGDSAFRYCPRLTDVTIPASVTNIGSYVFYSCSSLTGVYFQGNAPSLGPYAFNSTPAIIYYLPGTTGWGATFGGRPTALWNP